MQNHETTVWFGRPRCLSLDVRRHPRRAAACLQSRPVTATATIEAIDKANRVLTLKGAGGNSVDVTAPEQMEGFNPGDTVDVTYYESLLIKVGRPAKRP